MKIDRNMLVQAQNYSLVACFVAMLSYGIFRQDFLATSYILIFGIFVTHDKGLGIIKSVLWVLSFVTTAVLAYTFIKSTWVMNLVIIHIIYLLFCVALEMMLRVKDLKSNEN